MQQPNLEVGSGGDRLTRQPAKQEENIKNALGGNRLTEGIEHDSHNHGDPPMGRALRTRRAAGMLQEGGDEGGAPVVASLNIDNPLRVLAGGPHAPA